MKEHSVNFKNNLIKMGRQIDSVIEYDGTTLHDELYSVSVLYKGSLLKSVMKELDIESSVDIPKGTILNYKMGIKGSLSKTELDAELDHVIGESITSDFEYIDYGNYVVYSSERQEDEMNYKIVCYDKMLYSMKPYEDLGIAYPITIRSYISAIATKLGLEFVNEDEEFANYDREILNEKYLDIDGHDIGYTFRDVLDELAQVTASTICINNDDELEIRYIQEIPTNNNEIQEDYIITEEQLKDVNVDFGEKFGPVNSIVLSRGESDNIYIQDEDSIEQNGLCEIKIKDNQIMNGNDRDEYLPDILEQLDGLEYYINDYSSIGICYLELCDQYKVQAHDNEYNCIMFNDEIDIGLGIEENINTEMPEQAETDYTKADKTDRRINQTTLIVDKHNQQIQTMITQIGDREGKATSITQDIDHIESIVDDTIDLTDDLDEENPIVLENCREGNLLELRIKGNNTVFKPLVPTNSLVPSNTLVPLSSLLLVHSENLKNEIVTEQSNYLLAGYISPTTKNVFLNKRQAQQNIYYIEVEANREYVIRVSDDLLSYDGVFRVGTFGENVFWEMQEEQPITIDANVFDDNRYYEDGEYYYNTNLREIRIKTTENDKYLFINFNGGISNIDVYMYYQLVDLGITTELKQVGQFYDEYVIKEGKGYELRRIGSGGTIIENPEPTNVRDLSLILAKGNNYIDIPQYTTRVYAKWVIYNEITNYFATDIELQSSIEQSANEIKLSVMEEVTDEFLEKQTIESSIDLGILEDEGYIKMKTNKLTIDSDNFKLTKEGQITASSGKIANWTIENGQFKSPYCILNPNGSSSTDWALQVNPNRGFISGYPSFGVRNDGYVYGYSFNVHSPSSTQAGQIDIWNANGETGTKIIGGTIKTAWVRCSEAISSGGNTYIFRGFAMHGGFESPHSSTSGDDDWVDSHRYFCYWTGSKLDFNVDGQYIGHAVIDNGSDRRLKGDIKDIPDNVMKAISELQFKDYYFLADDEKKRHPGIIAQDLIEIFEKNDLDWHDYGIVYEQEREGPEGYTKYYSINYENLDTYVIAYLKDKVEKQDEIIKELQGRIEKLEKGEK